jgi:hypothetical protein
VPDDIRTTHSCKTFTASPQIRCAAPASRQEPRNRQVMPDDHSKLVPPLPIPNRTVKRLCADDSAATSVKVGHRQACYTASPQPLLAPGGFCVYHSHSYFPLPLHLPAVLFFLALPLVPAVLLFPVVLLFFSVFLSPSALLFSDPASIVYAPRHLSMWLTCMPLPARRSPQ